MLYVIIALLPAAFFGIYNFGYHALILILVTIASCLASEWIFDRIVHKKNSLPDLSAVVTGLLLALNLPAGLPWWEAVIGGVFAIVIVKMLFGGLGQNFMNPALGGRCFLLIAFAADMTNYASTKYEAYSGATPLGLIRNEGLSSVNVMDMLIGKIPGTIGETSVIAILIGAIILILLGVIDLKIPASYIITFAIFMFIFGAEHFNVTYVVAELCGGGLMLGAFFMATDYVTSPITPTGQIIFGICCGLLTGIFRCFGANAEGVSFAIILSNLLVPIIEKFTVPTAFGVVKEAKKHE
jgi:RnfABCDGE-type electron transport complex D subunit